MSVSYSHFERQQTYRSIRRILTRFEEHDLTLARMSELARADGYGCGDTGGGRSKGDHSDPTAAAVSARVDGHDDASRAFAALQEALVAFGQADVLLRRALPAPASDADGMKRPRPAPDVWCTSCARVRDGKEQLIFEPRTSRPGGRRDLCDWCQGEWLGSGEAGKRSLPDERLIIARHYYRAFGGHLTVRRRAEWLGLSVGEAKKRCFPERVTRARMGA